MRLDIQNVAGGGENELVRSWIRGVDLLTTMRDDHVVQDSTEGAYLHQRLDAVEARRPVEYFPLLVEDTVHTLSIFAPPFLLSSKVLVFFTVPLGRVDQQGLLRVDAVAQILWQCALDAVNCVRDGRRKRTSKHRLKKQGRG